MNSGVIIAIILVIVQLYYVPLVLKFDRSRYTARSPRVAVIITLLSLSLLNPIKNTSGEMFLVKNEHLVSGRISRRILKIWEKKKKKNTASK